MEPGGAETLIGGATAVTGGTPREQKRRAHKGTDYFETGYGEDTASGKAVVQRLLSDMRAAAIPLSRAYGVRKERRRQSVRGKRRRPA
jgi:hypothetical protein